MQYGFSTKRDGSMRLPGLTGSGEKILHRENEAHRRRYFESLGFSDKKIIAAQLVHGKHVAVVESHPEPFLFETDGLVTRNSAVVLTITAADCYPVYFFDEEKEIIGLAHVGWQGASKDIVSEMVGKMKALGSTSGSLRVMLGPGICQEHYSISPERAAFFKEYPKALLHKGKAVHLDLRHIIRRQLKMNHIATVTESTECTACLPEKYFSFRRDQPEILETQVAYIAL